MTDNRPPWPSTCRAPTAPTPSGPSRLIRWAEKVGPATGELVARILESRPHPEQGYKAVLGLMRLGRQYGNPRLDAGSARAIALGSCRIGVSHRLDRPQTTHRAGAGTGAASGMTAVTRRADGEGTAALTAGSLSEGLVHGVGARGAISDWTTDPNRVTTARTGSVCRSSGRSRGSGWGTTGPSPHV